MLSLFYPHKRSASELDDDIFEWFSLPTIKRRPYKSYSNDIKFNVYENKEDQIIEARLPEKLGKDDVKVHIKSDEDGTKWLHVTINQEESSKSEDGRTYQKYSSKTQRSFSFDAETYDIQQMKASLKNNKLRVSIPKKINSEEDPHKIDIEIEE